MSMDIAMLLDMDNLDDSTGISPSRTLYSSPLGPPRICASLLSTSRRPESQVPKTPESRNQVQLVTSVADFLPNHSLTWSSQIQPTNGSRHFIQVSVSPSRRSTRTIIAAHISTPGLYDESLTIPGSTTAAAVSSSGSFYLGRYSPTPSTRCHTSLLVPSSTEINDDLQWQMYLTPSLSNPLNEMDFDNIQHSPLSLDYPSDPIISNSRPASVVDPFDVFNPSPYLSRITARNMSNVNRHEADDSSANDRTLAIPNGTYAALMELTPPAFDFGSARFSSLEAPSASILNASPSAARTPPSRQRGRSPTVSRRGLSGWENEVYSNDLQVPLSSLNNRRKRRRSTPMSPIALRRAYRTPAHTASSNPGANANSLQPLHSSSAAGNSKLKKLKPSVPNVAKDLSMESDNDNDRSASDSDSDDYHPSRSVSPVPTFSVGSSTRSLPTKRAPEGSFEEMNRLVSKKKTRKGKGKAKGSAALALAVVTQLGMKSRSHSLGASNGEDGDEDTFDALALYKQGKTGIRKRKNHPIPLPVPIPNLNKKSRGRKVPFVVADVDSLNSVSTSDSISSSSNSFDTKEGSVEAKAELEGSSTEDFVPQSRRRKGKSSASGAGSQVAHHGDEYGGARSYVCVVPGCGKCFVRGEHLKRHVRSIHTHDKPHPCPYEGCDKSFSRRDNLGQHVRIHLQP